jgi:hypothetical protein
MNNKIELFDSENIDQLIWPETEEGHFAKKLLLPLIKHGVQSYFDNVQTNMMALQIDNFVLPITINDAEVDNSYVCSFYSYYIGCGLNNLDSIKNKTFQKGVETVLKGLGKFLRAGKIDKVVSVNNWLFSTNLYPNLSENQILDIRNFIEKKFPTHAIAFRSINTIDKNSVIQALKNNRFNLIASRQIFITNSLEKEVFESRLFKSDIRFLNKTEYEVGELTTNEGTEIPKMLSLYRALYIDKYSSISPQLNEKFLQLLVDNQIFKFKTLKKNNQIDGIVGYYSAYGVMMSPFFGYDTKQPQQVGLYRLLSTILSLQAKDSGELFHQSSGASFYKSVRRAKSDIEYIAIYSKHLGYGRRFYWKALKIIMNYFGIYWMKKY